MGQRTASNCPTAHCFTLLLFTAICSLWRFAHHDTGGAAGDLLLIEFCVALPSLPFFLKRAHFVIALAQRFLHAFQPRL